ncbi:NAD-dependent epimerase/dehydratase family protein [Flavobacterium succinicans]|uniref:GDP-6-deoxy-D-mannose reductase n=1 Tax=Flavobacterium succinicans TaxID=29536 RepID=A0A199XNT8_9FLAO|nr:NAD-dependent epimerase/dehydratase family protein [Flavobacterium succinicans]OAZ03082.1 GDP-6-deoxy-D-mannose reductase [Flavobacterium succinicans]
MVLLTGVTGFLGISILNILSSTFKVFGLSRTGGDYRIILESEIPKFNSSFELVIHAAGKAHSVPRTEAERKQFYDINVEGTLNLLKGLEISGVPKQFVFISSVSVYGQESGIGINEEHKLDAKDAYGLSKIEAELMVQKWCNEHNVVCTILRLPLLVGKNPPGNLGAMIKGIAKGYYFNIGGGKAKKSMVLVDDVAEFIPIVANMGGVYNLTDGYHSSFFELSSAISEQLKKSRPMNMPLFIAKAIAFMGDFLGSKAPINSLKLKKITADLTFDDSKARSVGWQPRKVLDWFST